MSKQSERVEILGLLREWALLAGQISLKYFNPGKGIAWDNKEGHLEDAVTIADTEIRDVVIPQVVEHFGSAVTVLTEESAKNYVGDRSKPLIIVDELDGTSNFSEGKSDYCMLWAYAEPSSDGYEVTASVVYVPVSGEFYYATADTPAMYENVNGEKSELHVSSRSEVVDDSPISIVLARGTWPIEYPREYIDVADALDRLRSKHKEQTAKNRRFCAGLEVMDVARGDLDFYCMAKWANWDCAAPSLILRRAGGQIYIAKTVDGLITFVPWKPQMKIPGEYYPGFVTNGIIDASLSDAFREVLDGLNK